MRAKGRKVYQAAQANNMDEKEWQRGTFIKPTLIELDSFDELQKEIFGPVLHVVRFQRQNLAALVDQINASGYGLTLGIHTRIDETIAQVTEKAKVGNLYVNRNMVGAVVGVQPFGGEGLSGTGPKAGGPLYLYRLLCSRPEDAVINTLTHHDSGQLQNVSGREALQTAHHALIKWAEEQQQPVVAQLARRYGELAQGGTVRVLPGPTGERNTYALLPRQRILCLADTEADALTQLAAVLAIGSEVLWPENTIQTDLCRTLPAVVKSRITLTKDWQTANIAFDGVIYHGDADQLRILCEQIAQIDGPIISVQGFARGETNILLERLLIEHSLSVNTAAAGGNASLMTIG